MPRMPQIPEPEISGRPGGGRLGGGELPNLGLIGQPLEAGANLAGNLGDRLEALQQQRDAALQKAQGTLDAATAITANGAHADRLRNIAAGLQEQYLANPQAAIDAFKTASQEQTNAALTDPDLTPGAQLHMQKLLAESNVKAQAAMSNWGISQKVRNAKNQLLTAEFNSTHGLENLATPGQLWAHINDTLKTTAELHKGLTADPELAQKKLAKEQVNAWVEQRSAVSGQAALDVIAQLNDPKSSIYKSLDADERRKGIKKAEATYAGAQDSAAFALFAQHTQHLNNLGTLLQANDPKFPQVALSTRKAVQAQMDSAEKDPSLSAETKERFQSYGNQMLQSVDAADTAFRKQRGLAQTKVDQEVRGELTKRFGKMFSKGTLAVNDHYEEALTLRHDATEAYSKGSISYQTYSMIEQGLKAGLQTRDTAEARNTGGLHATIKGMDFGMQSARQAGNEQLNNLFAGAYKKATPEQQNDAREYYLQQVLKATMSGANVDHAAARKMATDAADFVVGK